MLALDNLHDSLKAFTLYRTRVGDILKLLEYVYANTSGEQRDPMRALVTDYMDIWDELAYEA